VQLITISAVVKSKCAV